MKKVVSVAIILVMMCLVSSPVFALQENFKFSVSPTEKTVKPGEEVEIDLKVSDITAENGGINAVQGILSQSESNIIEKFSLEGNEWSAVLNKGENQGEYEREKGTFVISGGSITANKKIGTLKVKVKSDAKAGDVAYIYLKDVHSSYAKQNSTEEDKTNSYNVTIKLTVQADLTPDAEQKPEPEKKPTTPSKDNTIADKEFSDAGIAHFAIIAVVLGLISISTCIIYKNYKVK